MIYILTIGISAFLLFLVQPLIARFILPVFGGGASIWLTCLIFFQLLLLLGYSIVHFLGERLSKNNHLIFQLILLIFSLIAIPLQVRFDLVHNSANHPVLMIFLLLLTSVGLPYLVLSTTSPTLQLWWSHDIRLKGKNPYFQYAVSNAGSLIGLLSFPIFFEPTFTNSQQANLWSKSYIIFFIFFFIAIIQYYRFGEKPVLPLSNFDSKKNYDNLNKTSEKPLLWVFYSMVPSAALVIITYYLTVDIVNVPLLWVIPLAIYLITFIIAFAYPRLSQPNSIRTLVVFLPVALLFAVRRLGPDILPFWVQIGIGSLALFAIGIFFHGNLERSKPAVQRLTVFYLYLSLGGCLGSVLAGIISPLIFNSTYEFNIMIIVSLATMSYSSFKRSKLPFKVSFSILFFFLLIVTYVIDETTFLSFIKDRERSFYGSYEVQFRHAIPNEHIAARLLVMGTTIHGGEAHDNNGNLIPITYFHENTGIGKVFKKFSYFHDVGIVGLGTGVIAYYGKTKEHFDFYEIDKTVVHIAKTQFHNLSNSKADIKCIIGDARLQLRHKPHNSYDILILDAFTSGAIPMHLLTIEAMQEFLRVLKPQGLILYHISNRHVRLWSVLNGTAEKLHLYISCNEAIPDTYRFKTSATWVVLTRSKTKFRKLTSSDSTWKPKNNNKVFWYDNFSNLWSVLSFNS